MPKLLYHPFASLILFSIAVMAMFVVYLVAGLSPSPTFEFIASFFWALLLALWIVADARRNDCVPCFDFGFFCYMFLPIAVPWYCVWSRGWWGLTTLATIFAIWLAPYFVASLVWRVLYG